MCIRDRSLHLIFVVTWFAGLFYEPRLFIYHIEASKKSEPEKQILEKQLKIMSRRLWYIITWPSAILATTFAIWLLILMPQWLYESWMLIKISFVLLLFAYHIKTHQIFLHLQRNEIKYSSNFMRIWNEGATLFLFAIVFLAIVKSAIHWIFMVLGTLGLIIFLVIAIKLYKRVREKSGLDKEMSRILAIETLIGSSELLRITNESPKKLREAVTSPGGTTEAGLNFMKNNDFEEIIFGTIKAAIDKSIELSKES